MSASYPDLSGRVVVVTGASKALGAATARAFADNGAKVVVSGRDPKGIDATVASIVAAGGTAIGVPADVTRAADLAELRAHSERELGPATILCAFAGGFGEPAPSLELDVARWRQSLELNLTGTFMTLQEFLPAMIAAGGGSIVTMASAAARQPAKSNAAYAAAKAGVIALTRHLASELGPRAIRVNCISPSAVLNERMEAHMDDAAIDALGKSFPLGRIGRPDDVANAAMYLASESSGWITGAVLDVAGGKIMV